MVLDEDLLMQAIAKAHGVPMSMIDGRPWVPTLDEEPGDVLTITGLTTEGFDHSD